MVGILTPQILVEEKANNGQKSELQECLGHENWRVKLKLKLNFSPPVDKSFKTLIIDVTLFYMESLKLGIAIKKLSLPLNV